MNAETLSPKRYRYRTFVCAACQGITDSTRAHAMTCSPKCRVALHRHPELLDDIKAKCSGISALPAMVLEARAIFLLRPDLEEKVRFGTIKLEDTREEVHAEYLKLLREQQAQT